MIGAGYIAVELAGVFMGLGTDTTLVLHPSGPTVKMETTTFLCLAAMLDPLRVFRWL